MQREPWSRFASVISASPTKYPAARAVAPDDLVDMRDYRQSDALSVFVAYAQDNHLFDTKGVPMPVDDATYRAAPREQKVNKFGRAYRTDATVWLHRAMADIVVDAARFMHAHYGWRCIVYDGLRTVDAAYLMYCQADDSDLTGGLLSTPGQSAHNKGMAVDLVMLDAQGTLVPMGGNFDHLDMRTNHRNYRDFPADILENRRRREIAFQHAALTHGRLFAPLRSEFWDERFPEYPADHWRVLESLSRCLGAEAPDFSNRWPALDYSQFCAAWHALFDSTALRAVLHLPDNVMLPPAYETVLYHGDYNPLYDRDLLQHNKHLTDNPHEI